MEDKDNAKLQRNWVGQVFATSYSSFSKIAAILVVKILHLGPLIVLYSQDPYVIVKSVLSGKAVTLMNLYWSPGYSPDFLSKAFAEFAEMASKDSFVGDFNCHLNPSLDELPPGISPHSGQARVLPSICHDIGYSDVWRELRPTDSVYLFLPPLPPP